MVGQALTADQGTWTGTQPLAYAYAWLRCASPSDLGTCTTIFAATASTYTVSSADAGSYLHAQLTATNSYGSAVAISAATAQVTDPPPAGTAPVNTTAPTISGTATVGQTLTASPGSWTGTQPFTYTYAWQTCSDPSELGSCADIFAATANTYTVADVDAGSYLRVQVSASNSSGSALATSAATAQVTDPPPAGTAPANTTVPAVSGTAAVGQTLTATQGTWTGTQPITYSHSWQRCTSPTDPGTCTGIPGATASAYTITSADEDSYLRVQVTATNVYGSATASSAATAQVDDPPPAGTAPANTTVPAISGTAAVGQTLTATRNLDRHPADRLHLCLAALHQRRARKLRADLRRHRRRLHGRRRRRRLVPARPGHRHQLLRVGVATSPATAQVDDPPPAGTAPANTTVPAISGTATVGQTLTADPGSWTGTQPIAHTYAWERCTDPSDLGSCAAVSGAAASTYAVASADAGAYLRVEVAATNSYGTAAATSPATAQVDDPPPAGTAPANTTVPAISGTAAVGQTLTATQGTWTGTQPITYSHSWQRCTSPSNPGSCTAIPGATASAYTITSADEDSYLRVQVTATNAYGSATATSAATAQVDDPPPAGTAPANTTVPAISGTAAVGQTLTATQGTWTGTQPITYSHSWQRCTSPSNPGSCTAVPGATASAYTIASADEDSYLRVQVTATNAYGSATASSAATAQVDDPPPAGTAPANTTVPAISGTAAVGQTLTATQGTWTGTQPITYSHSWQRCTSPSNPSSCTAVSGATSSSYTIASADTGAYLRVQVTATNSAGSATATSTATAQVTTPPPPSAGLANVWVSPTGSDTGSNCTRSATPVAEPSNPSTECLTWDKAYRVASLGDTVGVSGGTFPAQTLARTSTKPGTPGTCNAAVDFQGGPVDTSSCVTFDVDSSASVNINGLKVCVSYLRVRLEPGAGLAGGGTMAIGSGDSTCGTSPVHDVILDGAATFPQLVLDGTYNVSVIGASFGPLVNNASLVQGGGNGTLWPTHPHRRRHLPRLHAHGSCEAHGVSARPPAGVELHVAEQPLPELRDLRRQLRAFDHERGDGTVEQRAGREQLLRHALLTPESGRRLRIGRCIPVHQPARRRNLQCDVSVQLRVRHIRRPGRLFRRHIHERPRVRERHPGGLSVNGAAYAHNWVADHNLFSDTATGGICDGTNVSASTALPTPPTTTSI